ncbi:hypothetical protein L596_011900 [Steinernema carpocapsae]|uniref:Uncharacterized protein n=1 Tax=Steinernema carpocapsae TaxID=34508 RepID=A0A4U5NW93_STECR|nr:hypothetical protein L596_011900 [Steinernema carpocapsae]
MRLFCESRTRAFLRPSPFCVSAVPPSQPLKSVNNIVVALFFSSFSDRSLCHGNCVAVAATENATLGALKRFGCKCHRHGIT